MAYRAIYRKWRPLTFEDVVGQKHITETLKTELKTGKIAHAYLFCGTRGTGKTTTAKILSRAVNCENPLPNGNPCNECESCKGILSGAVVDVAEIDAASNNGVDNIRQLREEIIYSPANVKYKVYIIDEVHMLSPGAFNALLKTLEEPPAHAIFILATTEPHKIPATIRSRCQRFDFRRISQKDIAGRIGEIVRGDGIQITQDAINFAAELGDGSMRDALSVLDLCSGCEGEITREYIENAAGVPSENVLFDIAFGILSGDFEKCVVSLDKIAQRGMEMTSISEGLISVFREMMMCKMLGNPDVILDKSEDKINSIKEKCASFEVDGIIYCIKVLSEYAVVLKSAGNPRAVLEAAFVKLCRPECDEKSDSYGARLAKIENIVNSGVVPVKQQVVQTVETPPQPREEKTTDEPPFDLGNEFKMPEVKVEEPEIPAPPMLEVKEETEMQLPPMPEPPPEPMFFDESVPVAEEPVSAVTSRPEKDESYKAFLKLIESENAPLASLLSNTTREIKNDTVYIVFEDPYLRDMVSKNEIFSNVIKRVAGCPVKFVTENGDEKSGAEADPLDELITKLEGFEQINFF